MKAFQLHTAWFLPLLSLLATVLIAADEAEDADTIYPGDTVTIVKDGVELGLRDKAATTLNSGDKLHVTEVRGNWIGGYCTKSGERYTGWVSQAEVKLVVVTASEVTRIELPPTPDDAAAVAALRELNVKLDLNDKGNVHAADGTESKLEDAGMAHFQGLHQLTTIDLSNRPITDEGFKLLAASKVLLEIYLGNSQITEASLARIGDFANLEVLALPGSQVKDAGLQHLPQLKSLRVLNLESWLITDAGMAHLEKATQLEVLALNDTKITTAGLVHLKPLAKLRVLNIIGCDVDDQGLDYLRGLEELRMLYVKGTKVTVDGKESLKEAAPSLAIFDD